MDVVVVERRSRVTVVRINRPEVRNAVDRPTADALATAFRDFDADGSTDVAVLTGTGTAFCAGADLGAFEGLRLEADGDGPLGPSRLRLRKPVVAAVEGHAVAGGLELALWCDLRVVSETAVFGVFCRRFGVPLVDGGTVRLPRLVGQGRALDMILTGRPVDAREALAIGLGDRLVPAGSALTAALSLAEEIARHPQTCMRNDRESVYAQWSMRESEALRNEARLGRDSLASGDAAGATAGFLAGQGRHGEALC